MRCAFSRSGRWMQHTTMSPGRGSVGAETGTMDVLIMRGHTPVACFESATPKTGPHPAGRPFHPQQVARLVAA